MQNCGIYLVRHRASGKCYIGLPRHIPERWLRIKWHINQPRLSRRTKGAMKLLWSDKNGKCADEAFSFSILYSCKPESLRDAEAQFVQAFNERGIVLYNIAAAGGLGRPTSLPVVRCSTGERFASAAQASKALGLHPNAVGSAMRAGHFCAGSEWIHEGTKPKLRTTGVRGRKRRTINLDTGTVFESAKAAADSIGMRGTAVTNAIHQGVRAGGFRWEYEA